MNNTSNEIEKVVEQINKGLNDFSGNLGKLYVEMANYISLVKIVNENISQNISQGLSPEITQSIQASGKKIIINIDNSASNSNTPKTNADENAEKAPTAPKKGEKTKEIADEMKKFVDEAKKSAVELMDCFEGIDEETKTVVKACFDIGSSVLSGISSISGLVMEASDGTKLAAGSAAAAVKGLETASVIIQILSAAIAITKAIFQMCDVDNERLIKKNESKIKRLKREFKELGAEIEKAYGFDKSAKLDEQTTKLEEQKRLIEEQKKAEDSKKSTDKSKMEGYKDQLTDINLQIEKNKEASIDAVFGADLDSAISSFTDAYLAAWDSGGKGAEVQKDVVKKMIKGMINEIMKSNIADKVKKLREMIQDAMLGDGIDAQEQAMIDAQADDIFRQMEKDSQGAEMYLKGDDPEREASKKGFGAITQESANELNGKFTTIQEHTAQIKNSITTLILNSGGMLKHLAGIESNTSHCLRLESIQSDMNAVKTGIGIMTTKGVKML